MSLLVSLKRFWNQWHNKLLALVFSITALVFFLINVLYEELIMGWQLYVSFPEELWNLFVYCLVYGIMIYGNVKNNNIAYSGILMFLFMLFLDAIFSLIRTGFISVIASPIGLISLLIQVGTIAFGILYYVNIYKYLNYRSDDFKKLRIFGILFSVCLFLKIVPSILLTILTEDILTSLIFFVPMSEFLASVGCIFTVERIKRD